MSNPEKFRFIQFEVEHTLSTMKVGADAVLLGALTELENTRNILDIGMGCGIIALMLAQRGSARIDAIDIDENSVKEAERNFANSPWNDRLKVSHASLADFSKSCQQQYDLIVSNPPFFQNDLLPDSGKLRIAKHATTLDFDTFIKDAKKIMADFGRLSVILPTNEASFFTKKCLAENVFLTSTFQIIPRTGKEPNRLILTYSKIKTDSPVNSSLTVRDETGQYSQDYKNLTSPFHPPQYFSNK